MMGLKSRSTRRCFPLTTIYILLLACVVISEASNGLSQPMMKRESQTSVDETREMTRFEKELDKLRMESLFSSSDTEYSTGRRLWVPPCDELCKQCIEISVYFHLSGYHVDPRNASGAWMIPHPTDEFRRYQDQVRNRTDTTVFPEIEPGRFSSIADIYQLIEANMGVLNDLYKDTTFRFRWVNNNPDQATVGVQNNWAFLYAGSVHRSNGYATAMHQGDLRTLNVYLVYRICGHELIWVDANCQTIGAGTNPSYQLDRTADGVYVSYDTLTGGGLDRYSNGISLAHEVGHWLGLLHVFQSETLPDGEVDNSDLDPCDPMNVVNGDFVDDTPFLPEPSVFLYRCSVTYYEAEGEEMPNSCPNLPGVDPVWNIMNYVNDEDCMNDGHARFTCGQNERMYKQWLLYRDHEDQCAGSEWMMNLTIGLDGDSLENVHAEIAQLQSNTPLFDLKRDMDLTLFPKHAINVTRNLAFCVPEGEYVMAVTDARRDGFTEGYIELSVDGKFVHRVEGNFGSTECLKFGANGITSEMRNGVESTGASFGEPYHFDVESQVARVSCSTLDEPFYEEPILISKGRFMKVDLAIEGKPMGVCIKTVSRVEIGVAGSNMVTVFPSVDGGPQFFSSSLSPCGGHSCVVSFDLSLLEAIQGSNHQDGVYNTTCTATVHMGFGEACDDFLKDGGIDCSARTQREVFTPGEGQILFLLPASPAGAGPDYSLSAFAVVVGLLLM